MTSNQTLKHYPLSSPQLDIWFYQILHPNVPLYNIGGYARIDGPIDQARFEKALNQVIEENDALRIILHEGKSLPTQTFAENVHINLDFYDFSEKENAHELALKWMKQEFVKPFQLYDGLLFQFALCKISANCYYGFKKYHHLIADGWAISLIVQRVAAAYNALSTGKTGEHNNYAYPDFIQNDQAYLESEKFVKAKHYWQNKYREVPEPLLVRNEVAHKPGKILPSQRSTLCLKRAFYNQVNDFAFENKVSTFHVILGALYCYFVRTCYREDLVIGLPTLNRSSAAFKQMVGMFVGVSPAWFRFGTDLNFVELVKSIRQELQKDYRHQRFPIGEINRQLGRHQQLFDLTLSYAKHDYDVNFNGHPAHAVYFRGGFEQNALAVFIEEFHQQDDVNIYFDYNLGAFDKDEIERLKARFEFLLGEILRQPSVPIRELQIMPFAELNKILVEFNDTATDYPRDKTIVDLFEEQVAKTPNAIAVIFENQQLTYQELNTKANQLAHYLQTLGVKPEILVGICVERSCEMVIGLLGILKAEGAYLPLDPAYPVARLAFMLEDAQVPVLLTQSGLKEGLPETKAQIVCLDVEAKAMSQPRFENPVSDVKPDNLAYVIYTSGSTGNPKGVQIAHSSLLNFLTSMRQQLGLTSADVLLATTAISFDIAALEIYLPLIVGAKIVLAHRYDVTDGEKLLKKLNHDSITVMQATPATWHLLVATNWKSTPQLKILCGGEALLRELATQLLEKCQNLCNLYGPTETTIWSLMAQVTATTDPISIGHPIANTQTYILDQYLQPVPIGVSGEFHIGGAGLARGYLNRPDLTADKFINNPFSDDPNWLRRSKDSRLYKTGDLARYLPDGNIEFLGRIDNQVKIRGFRIELSEIEAVLATHPFVTENAVIVHEASETDKRLVAYLVPHQGQVIENTALRDFLKERLPDYMIPSAFVTLENLPLTPNGKIDRRALSQLSVSHYQLSEKTFVAPQTPDEELLAGLWASVLGIEQVGVHDNFFDLGGHSLLAVNLMTRIEQQFGQKLPLSTLVEGPTIEKLATFLNQSTEKMWSSLVAIQPNGTKQPFFCVPGIGGNVTDFYELALKLGNEQPFYGLQAVGLDGKSKPYTNIEDMATHYLKEIQTVQPQGPYLLGGHSFGALVAFEMSQQLQKQGHEVTLLAIIEMIAPNLFNKLKKLGWNEAKCLSNLAQLIERRLGKPVKVSDEMLQRLESEGQLNELLEQFKKASLLPPDAEVTHIRGLIDVYKANCRMDYIPKNIKPTRIVFFQASEFIGELMGGHNELVEAEPTWGWNQYASGSVDIHVVPGDHHTMMSQPHVPVLAEKLKKCLDKVQ